MQHQKHLTMRNSIEHENPSLRGEKGSANRLGQSHVVQFFRYQRPSQVTCFWKRLFNSVACPPLFTRNSGLRSKLRQQRCLICIRRLGPATARSQWSCVRWESRLDKKWTKKHPNHVIMVVDLEAWFCQTFRVINLICETRNTTLH